MGDVFFTDNRCVFTLGQFGFLGGGNRPDLLLELHFAITKLTRFIKILRAY